MADAVVRALVPQAGLKVSVVVATELAREARQRHGLAPAAAVLFAQGLAAGGLLASLQKEEARINLQLECDGPLRGFFVDASVSGAVRGYVKNPAADVALASGRFQWRGLLGNQGFISVLKESGGQYYRSSVELTAMQLSEDLNHYFRASEQVPTRVALEVTAIGDEPLGVVAGVLVQALPDGDLEALAELGRVLPERLRAWLEGGGGEPEALLGALFPGETVLARVPLRFSCTCSRERALATLAALGADDVQNIVDTMGSTAVTCHFCGSKHEVSLEDLWGILASLGRPQLRN